MEEETVEVQPSDDNGNLPVETPNPEPTPAIPTEPTEPVPTTEPELFELPDGRKVDAETLSKEWKDNFLPDYTRKSQELAKTKTETLPNNETPQNSYADPNWEPQTYAEIIEAAKLSMKEDLVREQQQVIERQQAVESQVIEQLEEIKKTDPALNENALFLHATKYGFQNLKAAHQNMQDMSALAKNVQQTTVKNIAKRNDPVSITPGATGARPDPSNFATATEYLRSLQN